MNLSCRNHQMLLIRERGSPFLHTRWTVWKKWILSRHQGSRDLRAQPRATFLGVECFRFSNFCALIVDKAQTLLQTESRSNVGGPQGASKDDEVDSRSTSEVRRSRSDLLFFVFFACGLRSPLENSTSNSNITALGPNHQPDSEQK